VKTIAVMLDLGFLLFKLRRLLGHRPPTAQEVHQFAQRCVAQDEELLRAYCYHCPPYGGTQQHPLTRGAVNFKATATFRHMTTFIQELEVMENIAFRAGELTFNGWRIKRAATDEILKTGRALAADDFEPDIKQKRVDINIGLDVAWLAGKSIVDRIVLVACDDDFVPAMKFARREGVQVVVVAIGDTKPPRQLRIHADLVRQVTFP
jgi:uncharacterized protein (TIGR00288 family)